MIMSLENRPERRARPGLWTVIAVLLALALLLMAECKPDDSGPGSYDPSSGDTFWYPKTKR